MRQGWFSTTFSGMKAIPNDIFFAEVERLIAEGREVRMKVNGTSMRPFLQSGRDTVVLAPFSNEELTPGTIVLFRHHGKHILHRIIARDGENLIIQGDSVPTTEKATIGDVVAIVKEVVRENGRVVRNDSAQWTRIYRRHLRKKRMMKFLSRIKRAVLRRSVDK